MNPYYLLSEAERDEYDHDEVLCQALVAPNTARQKKVYLRAHDRRWGKQSACPYCQQGTLARIQKGYEAPAIEPTNR